MRVNYTGIYPDALMNYLVYCRILIIKSNPLSYDSSG